MAYSVRGKIYSDNRVEEILSSIIDGTVVTKAQRDLITDLGLISRLEVAKGKADRVKKLIKEELPKYKVEVK